MLSFGLGIEGDAAATGQLPTSTAEFVGFADSFHVVVGEEPKEALVLCQLIKASMRVSFVGRMQGEWRELGALMIPMPCTVHGVGSVPGGAVELLVSGRSESGAWTLERVTVIPEGGRVVERSVQNLEDDFWKSPGGVLCAPGEGGRLALWKWGDDGALHEARR